MERMFESGSINSDIIGSPSEARSIYSYFSHNVGKFRQELSDEGLSFADAEKEVRQCWVNLVQSCQKVGYMNGHMERIAKLYGVPIGKETQKA